MNWNIKNHFFKIKMNSALNVIQFCLEHPSFLNIKIFSFVFLMTLICFDFASAEKMDLEAHNLVIEKLESSMKKINSNDKGINLISLKIQLANLYSEKARLLFIEEGNQSCNHCLQSQSFKKKAIDLYLEILPELKNSDGGEVSLQLAYLLEENQSEKSFKIYNNLIDQKNINDQVRSKALNKRASYYFKQGMFDNAIKDYMTILQIKTTESKGPVLHKIAWAKFNKGEVDEAIRDLKLILKNQELMSLNSSTGKEFSDSFHREVARDLTLFMAKIEVNTKSIQELLDLTPEEDIVDNLLFLGEESERVGNSQNASTAWEWVLSNHKLSDEKKSALYLNLAKHHLNQNRFQNAFTSYNESLNFLNKQGFDKNNSNIRSGYRQLLMQWEKVTHKLTKSSKNSNSENYKISQTMLVKTYEVYLKYFDNDYEAHLWLGQLASQINSNSLALVAYGKAADLIADKIVENQNSHSSNGDIQKNQVNLKKLLSGSLNSEIRLTEVTSDQNLKLKAYDHYLKLNPQGEEKCPVQYQKAKLFYDTNQYQKSFELFNDIALDSTFENSDLKIKSAHLALDSLSFLKKYEDIEITSLKYSKIFLKENPKLYYNDSKEFESISYNAGMKQVQNLAFKSNKELKSTNTSDSNKALAKLMSLPTPSKDSAKYKNHLKAKIDLALEAQDWGVAIEAINEFSHLKIIKNNEREWALNKKLSISELLLDFNSSYKTILELQYDKSKNPDHLLKSALFAELTDHPIQPWLEKVIKSPQSTPLQKVLARVQLVRFSEKPWKTLRQQASYIKSYPELFAQIGLECFNSEPIKEEALWILKTPGILSTFEGQTIQRYLDIGSIKLRIKNLSENHLMTKSVALIASQLKNRVQSLSNLQFQFQKAQKNNDWTLQVILANVLKVENERLAIEIEKLPPPKKLKEKQKKEYQLALSKEAKPFLLASKQLDQFLEKTWKQKEYIQFLINRIENNSRTRGLLMNELRSIASVAPKYLVSEIQSRLDELKSTPSKSEISHLHSELRQDPFDLELQKRLVSLEKKRGNHSMVVFLEARNQNFKEGHL